MEELKAIFEETKNDISMVEKTLCDKNVLGKAQLLLQNLRVDTLVKPRIFLSSFLLYHFPKEMFHNGEDVQHLKGILSNIMNDDLKESELRRHICEYSVAFRKWSSEDLETLKNQLLHEYHQLSVEILNTDNEDMKYVYEKTQEEILKCAKTFGYDKDILNHSPVVIDTKKYEEQYTMALYDTLHVELREKKLLHTKQIMEYIQKFIKMFLPEEEQLNIPLLEQIIEYDAYHDTEIKSFFSNLYDCLKKIQAVKNDEQLEEFRSYLNSDKEVNIPKHLIFLLICVQSTVDDLENLKS